MRRRWRSTVTPSPERGREQILEQREAPISERGAALIVVLWLLAILGLLVGFFMQRSHLELLAARNFRDDSRDRQEVRAGINEGINLLLADDNDFDALSDPWAAAVDNDRYSLRIFDEGSRINLNAVSKEILDKLPGILPEEVAALLDWRDLDDETREGGAEDAYYMGLPEPYHIANGRFETREELRLVKGFSEIYDSLAEVVTVYGPLNVNTAAIDGLDALLASRGVDKFTAQFILNELIVYRSQPQGAPVGSLEEWKKKMPSMTEEVFNKIRPDLTVEGTINVNTAGRDVLLTLFGGLNLGDDIVDRLISAREKTAFSNPGQVKAVLGDAAAFDKVKNFFTTRSAYFTIEARAKRGNGAKGAARVTVYRYHPQGEGKKWRVKILSWEE
ncbi:MAG: general secretion pathway protein GspK [Firmicutes bacterium]|nr:general secretion pathway protein GspK [Bacillota bacterium]